MVKTGPAVLSQIFAVSLVRHSSVGQSSSITLLATSPHPKTLHLLAPHQSLLSPGLLVLWNFGSRPGNLGPVKDTFLTHFYYSPLNNCSGFPQASAHLVSFSDQRHTSLESLLQSPTCFRPSDSSLCLPSPGYGL